MFKNIVEKDASMEPLSPCSNCKNKFEDELGCRAFKDIPMVILLGKNKHTKPLPEQENNIVFEKRD